MIIKIWFSLLWKTHFPFKKIRFWGGIFLKPIYIIIISWAVIIIISLSTRALSTLRIACSLMSWLKTIKRAFLLFSIILYTKFDLIFKLQCIIWVLKYCEIKRIFICQIWFLKLNSIIEFFHVFSFSINKICLEILCFIIKLHCVFLTQRK